MFTYENIIKCIEEDIEDHGNISELLTCVSEANKATTIKAAFDIAVQKGYIIAKDIIFDLIDVFLPRNVEGILPYKLAELIKMYGFSYDCNLALDGNYLTIIYNNYNIELRFDINTDELLNIYIVPTD